MFYIINCHHLQSQLYSILLHSAPTFLFYVPINTLSHTGIPVFPAYSAISLQFARHQSLMSYQVPFILQHPIYFIFSNLSSRQNKTSWNAWHFAVWYTSNYNLVETTAPFFRVEECPKYEGRRVLQNCLHWPTKLHSITFHKTIIAI